LVLFPHSCRVAMILRLKRIVPLLLAVTAGAGAILPAILFGMPNNNDLANHYHFAIPFYEALRHGDWYPGFFASPNFGYGDVVVRFYPPALYYLLAAGRFVTGNWYAGSLLAMTLVSAVGSLGAYFWARCYVPQNLAVAAALFYALMPYHLAEFYQAAQLAEFAAGSALLFALAFVRRICDRNRWRDMALLAVAYAALILSHLPLAVFGSITLLLYAVISLRRRFVLDKLSLSSGEGMGEGLPYVARPSPAVPSPSERGMQAKPYPTVLAILLKLTLGVLIGLGASSFYWVTMVAEMKWIVADGHNPDPLLDYSHNFVFSTFSPEKQETIWWMGLLAIATALMCLPAVIPPLKNFRVKDQRQMFALGGLLLFSFAMTTVISKPLWAALPYLRMAQHPFRWLAVTSVIAPVLMAAAVPFWRARLRNHLRPIAIAMCGCVVIGVTFSVSQTVRGATYLSKAHFEQIVWPLKEAPSIIQWLPVWASAAGHGKPSYEKCTPPPAANGRVDAGPRAVRVIEWNDTKRLFTVEAGAAGDARVATFYYPHWKATANEQTLRTSAAADGALLVAVPAQEVNVQLEFREPGRTTIAKIISIISWTLIGSLLIFGKIRDHATSDYEPIAN
jgi:6-pyruvoyl-tetrahydropterin synthase-like protein